MTMPNDDTRKELARALSNIPRCHGEYVVSMIEKLIAEELKRVLTNYQQKPLRFD